MSEVYILIITKEIPERFPEIRATAYGNWDTALRAYHVAVDEARTDAEDYEFPHEDSEIATASYRCYRIEERYGLDTITVTLETSEVIGEESDDI